MNSFYFVTVRERIGLKNPVIFPGLGIAENISILYTNIIHALQLNGDKTNVKAENAGVVFQDTSAAKTSILSQVRLIP